MTRKLTVWAGGLDGRQHAIVAAKSQREAVQAIRDQGWALMTIGQLRTYWSKTGNQEDIERAMSSPGTVFVNDDIISRGKWSTLREYRKR